MSKQWRGSADTPIAYPRASRQTIEQHTTRKPSLADDDADDRAWEPAKPHTSAVRFDKPIRQTAYLDKKNPKKTRRVRERTLDRSTLIVVGSLIIIVMVGGWWLLTTVSTWWTNWQDDLHYGNPRTFQIDQFVGQGDSPTFPDHFIVVNLHGRVVVMQMNLQHPELDQSYGITTTDPNTPVSLLFRQQGKTLVMFVVIGNNETSYTVELVSNGTKFVGTH